MAFSGASQRNEAGGARQLREIWRYQGPEDVRVGHYDSRGSARALPAAPALS